MEQRLTNTEGKNNQRSQQHLSKNIIPYESSGTKRKRRKSCIFTLFNHSIKLTNFVLYANCCNRCWIHNDE